MYASVGKLIAFMVAIIVLLYINVYIYYPAIFQLSSPFDSLLAIASPPIELVLLFKGWKLLDSI